MKLYALAVLAVTLLLGSSALLLGIPSGHASPVAPAPAAASYTISLWGSALTGWGLSPNSITKPGPALTVFVGDTVTLKLYSNDSAAHTFYIDLNKDGTNDTGDISAGSFSSKTTPLTFTFTVPNSPGTYTYACTIHPTVMFGSITIVSAPTFILYGSATAGWGSSATTITNPGPALSAHQGDVVTFELISADGQAHSFFIDIDRNGATPDSSDPTSVGFGGTSSPVASFTYTVAAAAGNYTYYCAIHGTAMEGTFGVLSTGGAPTAPPDYTLYAAVVLIVVIVAVVAVVVIRRKPRSPPTQPPAQPPQ